MIESHSAEYDKGYKALDILTMLGYVGCVIYLIMAIAVLTKAFLPGILMVFGSIVAGLGVYVFNKIGHAVFIVRDIQISQVNKTQG